jgi:RimJ/RimL family protein N-acetyltransferase
MTLILRPLEHSDIEWLRRLRNECRYSFFDTAEITPDQQEQWWKSNSGVWQRTVIWETERPDILVKWPPERVGYFSIISPKPYLPIFPTKKTILYFNSMMVVPEHRGRGVITTAAKAFRTEWSYIGYVSKGNDASLRACAKMGFVQRGTYHHPTYGPIEIVWRD